MTPRQFNAQFRPIVSRAWLAQCELTGAVANNKAAQDRWYREQIQAATNGRIRSTKDATDAERETLLSRFKMLARSECQFPRIDGWSDGQNGWFSALAIDAWNHEFARGSRRKFHVWLAEILAEGGAETYKAPDRKESFDTIMGHLAVIARDRKAMDHFAEAAEIRMRWQLAKFREDLAWLQKRDVDSSYIEGIWSQASLLPTELTDAPAQQLRKALAMIDTHIRRLCKDYSIRPMELPSRAHPHEAPVAIREVNHHIHVGHELEHCEPVHVDAELEELPF